MPRIAITGVTGLQNRGVEALLRVTTDELAGRIAGLKLSVLTETPEYDIRRLDRADVAFIRNGFRQNPRVRARLREGVARSWSRADRRWSASAQVIRKSDLVVATGGDVFSSDYGRLNYHLAPLRYALAMHRPVVFLAHSIGPFAEPREAQAWLSVARRSALVTVREQASYAYVTDDLGLPASLVRRAADPAFLLRPAADGCVDRVLHTSGIRPNGRFVALCPSRGMTTFRNVARDTHRRAWQNTLDELTSAGEVVLLIPHVRSMAPDNDDLGYATELAALASHPERVRILAGDYSAGEIKGVIARSSMVVTERMHAAIAGMSTRVATLVVGYSVKAQGIVTDLVGATLTPRMLINLDDFLTTDKRSAHVRSVWQSRSELSDLLAEGLPSAHERASESFALLNEILSGSRIGNKRTY